MAPYRADHRERVITDGPAGDAAAGDGAGRGAGPARACHQRRQVRRAVDRDRHAAASPGRIGGDALELEWTETGGPPAAPPASLGFGLTIVRSSIEAQFRGGVIYDWRPRRPALPLSIPARADRQPRAGAADGAAPAPKPPQRRARAASPASAC